MRTAQIFRSPRHEATSGRLPTHPATPLRAWRPNVVWLCTWCGVALVAAGCGDSASPSAGCTLPDDVRFQLTKVEIDDSRSDETCPAFAAEQWDTQALIEQGACVRSVADCAVELTCEYEGLQVYGRFVDRDGLVVGRLEVEAPIVCIYATRGEWAVYASDAGG